MTLILELSVKLLLDPHDSRSIHVTNSRTQYSPIVLEVSTVLYVRDSHSRIKSVTLILEPHDL